MLHEQAQPIFKDPKRFPEMADPLLNKEFSVKSLNQAVGVAAMCLQEEPTVRPYITDVVAALSFLEFDAKDPPPAPAVSPDEESLKENNNTDDGECSSYSDEEENDEIGSHANSSSDEEEETNDINEMYEEKSNSSMDHEESNSSMDHEDDEAALTIEFDHEHEHSPSEKSLEEDSGDEEYDDAENELKDRTKSTMSTNSNKGKVMELSDDESIYSSSSSRSSSSSEKKDEIGEKKSARQTVQRVKSKLKHHAGPKKIKNKWRKAKSVLHHKTKK